MPCTWIGRSHIRAMAFHGARPRSRNRRYSRDATTIDARRSRSLSKVESVISIWLDNGWLAVRFHGPSPKEDVPSADLRHSRIRERNARRPLAAGTISDRRPDVAGCSGRTSFNDYRRNLLFPPFIAARVSHNRFHEQVCCIEWNRKRCTRRERERERGGGSRERGSRGVCPRNRAVSRSIGNQWRGARSEERGARSEERGARNKQRIPTRRDDGRRGRIAWHVLVTL